MAKDFTELELEAYLDEALTPGEMAAVEAELRANPQLGRRLSAINGRRDAGVHTIGEIWRRHRISCPSREHLGSYLLDALDKPQMDYCRFHIEEVGCRLCQANLHDLRMQQEENAEVAATRRTKYFQSSAGYLRDK
ncbi:MAG: hypothetical protein H6822_26415 [Planctomycetaceae bacterium]|nr:hypothetical protein [Planctomycetaceae bacterium]